MSFTTLPAHASAVIVLGSSNTDLVIRLPRLPRPGETVLGGAFFQAAGGKGANQAVAAARASTAPVTFIAALGDDAMGDAAATALAKENLDLRFLKRVPGAASGVALIVVDAHGENQIAVASGANAALSWDDLDLVSDETWKAAKVFLTSLETPLDAVIRGLKRARGLGLRTVLNPAPAEPIVVDTGLLRLVDVLTPNEHEAAEITGVPTGDEAGAVAAARELIRRGCRAAIVTRGAAGCVVVEREGMATALPACAVTAVDATAAGDAFNGALAVALAGGRSLLDAARWASRAAALAVTRAGAQPSLPTRAEIEAFQPSDDKLPPG